MLISAVTTTIKAVFSMGKYQAEPQRVLLYLLTEQNYVLSQQIDIVYLRDLLFPNSQ